MYRRLGLTPVSKIPIAGADMHIVVDGYNLIRQSPVLRRREAVALEEGRQALLRSLAAYRQRKGHRITVVFDGWESGFPQEARENCHGVDIIFSRRGETADEVIKRLAGGAGEEIVVVTSDRAIAQYVSHRGGTAVASDFFESRLEGADDAHPVDASSGEQEMEKESDAPRGGKQKGMAFRPSRRQRAYLNRIKKL
jgi:predicted RNA-binding protein with PIN domain